MMDSLSYRKNVGFKLQNYILNGIFPTVQLITTYETKEKQLDLEVIEKIVSQYFT